MKTAVVMYATDAETQKLASITAPLWRLNAGRWVSRFHLVSDKTQVVGTMEKLRFGGVLRHYDRALLVDADTIVAPQAPCPFDLVPESYLGALIEWPDNLPPMFQGHHEMFAKEYQSIQLSQGWEPIRLESRFNSGVVVASRCHADLFTPWTKPISVGKDGSHCFEESWLNVQAARHHVPVWQLGYAWNAMRHYPAPWRLALNQRSANVYHFTGQRQGDRPTALGLWADALYPDRDRGEEGEALVELVAVPEAVGEVVGAVTAVDSVKATAVPRAAKRGCRCQTKAKSQPRRAAEDFQACNKQPHP